MESVSIVASTANYSKLLALLVHLLSKRYELSRTHVLKYVYMAEQKHLFPPILPTLDNYGVHSIDARIAYDNALRERMIHERRRGSTSGGRDGIRAKIAVTSAAGFDPHKTAGEIGISLADMERDVEMFARVYPPVRLTNEEMPGRLVRGRGRETLLPIYEATRDPRAWLYVSPRWLTLKNRAYFQGVSEGRIGDGLVFPVPTVTWGPERATEAVQRAILAMLRKKETVARQRFRISELRRRASSDLVGSDVLYVAHVIDGPWKEGDERLRAIVSESWLSSERVYRMSVDFDASGFVGSAGELRLRKLLIAGRLSQAEDYSVLAYAALSLGTLPDTRRSSGVFRQSTLDV